MRLGVSSYTYVWAVGVPGYPLLAQPMTARQLLDKAVELGVHVLQIADNLPLERLSDEELAGLFQRAQKHDVTLEVGTEGIAPERLRRYLQIAIRLRSSLVRTVLDTADHHPSPEEVIATLRPVASDFERAGVWLAIENHDRFPAATLVDIVNRIDSARVRICLDTANSLSCLETPASVVEALGPWTVNLHVKDFRYLCPPHRKGFVVQGCPAGQGQLDVPWLLETLWRQGYDGSAILELWPPPAATLEESVAIEDVWAAQSVRYLRQYVVD